MKKVLFITGLGHSGSTIVDMALGCHKNIVGLGEIISILNCHPQELYSSDLETYICSCGKTLVECDFWNNARSMLVNNYHLNHIQRYLDLIKYSHDYFEKDIIVDSSKIPSPWLCEIKNAIDFRVLYLVRDFRSWCYSRSSRHGYSLLWLALKWFLQNLKIQRFLNANGFNYLQVGYEEVALYPELIFEKITKFLDLEYSDSMLYPNTTSSHIIRGNIVRADSRKSKSIRYDARWFTSVRITLLSALFFPLLFWNNKWVYSNFLIGSSIAFGRKQKDFILFGNKNKEDMRHIIEGR